MLCGQASKSGASRPVWSAASSTVRAREDLEDEDSRAGLNRSADPIGGSLAVHPFMAKLVHVVLELIGIRGSQVHQLAIRTLALCRRSPGRVPYLTNLPVVPSGRAEQLVDLEPGQRDDGIVGGVGQGRTPARAAGVEHAILVDPDDVTDRGTLGAFETGESPLEIGWAEGPAHRAGRWPRGCRAPSAQAHSEDSAWRGFGPASWSR